MGKITLLSNTKLRKKSKNKSKLEFSIVSGEGKKVITFQIKSLYSQKLLIQLNNTFQTL
jgi:hypothetical protein